MPQPTSSGAIDAARDITAHTVNTGSITQQTQVTLNIMVEGLDHLAARLAHADGPLRLTATGALDIIGDRDLARAAAPRARCSRLRPPPSGGRQEGGSRGERGDWGELDRRTPLPPSPRWGEASERVYTLMLMTFLISDNVSWKR